mgnify:CR=1 FL=1|tara:strand:+ start:158 stop:841 length:684 start_codon:yes stop_codon:yes gene_type:complete
MSNQNVLKDIFADKSVRNKLSIFYTFAVALMIYQGAVFFVIKGDDISSKGDIPNFTISFTESSESFEDSRIVNDESREIISYTPSEAMFSTNNGMGMLLIDVTYDESSGEFQDRCDTVSVDLIPNSVPADWNNENNILTGTSDDCSEINLQLMIFPGYDGQTIEQPGQDSNYWQSVWTNQSFGNGDFELGIEVNVNQPPGQIVPTIQDNDEEVFVTWRSVFFSVVVE